MHSIEIQAKDKWDDFLKQQLFSNFLQSSHWLDFQAQFNHQVYYLGVESSKKELLAVAGIIVKKTPLGKNYFYCPRGPVLASDLESKQECLEKLIEKIKDLALSNKAIFLRLEADFFFPSDFKDVLKPSLEIQPSKTLILDLKKTETELLKNMHPKTRYNIKLASKKQVSVRDGSLADFNHLWQLMEETGRRDDFQTHVKNYYKQMLTLDPGFIKLKLAEFNQEIIAAGIFSFFGSVATYLHGASSYEHRRVMAPYSLQWQAILEAQQKNCHYYDFYGINEDKWPGVTRFKKGFGGTVINYPGTFDLVFNQGWYNVYKLFRNIRRKI